MDRRDAIDRGGSARVVDRSTSRADAEPQRSDDTPDPDADRPSEYPFDFSRVVDASTPPNAPDTETFEIPYPGRVTDVILGYPAGTQQAVGVAVDGPDGENLIPRGPRDASFVAFDDETLDFGLNELVQKNERITIKYANNDAENDHFLNVIIKLREVSNGN